MGTVVTIKIYDNDQEGALDAAFDKIHQLADRITTEQSSSEISAINAHAGLEPVQVSDEIYRLLETGLEYSRLAEGSFDISIGPISSLWRIGFDDARKPGQDEIEAVLDLVRYEDVVLDQEKQQVYLKKKGMKLDLGGIAKGYIADEVVKVLDQFDVTTAIIDLGGNIYVKGHHPTGGSWTVGIQNPVASRGEIIGTVQAVDQSIVTTGIYERYLEIDGSRYHHILSPQDGYPFMNEIAGVSVLSEHSTDGDALSTLVFSKGLQDGMALVESLEGIEAVFITRDKRIYLSSGLTERFVQKDQTFNVHEVGEMSGGARTGSKGVVVPLYPTS